MDALTIESYQIGGWFLFGKYGALHRFNVLGLSLNEVNLISFVGEILLDR